MTGPDQEAEPAGQTRQSEPPGQPARRRRHLFHLALATDWDIARTDGRYRVSTLGAGVDDVGYVHTCFRGQVAGVAERYYAQVADPLVLLTIDPDLVGSPVVLERAADTGELFPHVYGPVEVSAVVEARSVPRGADGRLELSGLGL